jgi:hypothetical protein
VSQETIITDGASFDAERVYRYTLRRKKLNGDLPGSFKPYRAMWIMLNPSTADETKDDPTIRRCIWFSRWHGVDEITVCNLYAFRATSPKELKRAQDPVGRSNDEVIAREAARCAFVVLACGAFVGQLSAGPARLKHVVSLLGDKPLRCLGLTAGGYPRHPLYIKNGQEFVRYSTEG